VIIALLNYVLLCFAFIKKRDSRRDITEDEFFFVIKSLLGIMQDSISEDAFEDYLNDMFFNTEHFARICCDKHNKHAHENNSAIRCLLLKICLKGSDVE
jgi:hypothetical protein